MHRTGMLPVSQEDVAGVALLVKPHAARWLRYAGRGGGGGGGGSARREHFRERFCHLLVRIYRVRCVCVCVCVCVSAYTFV